MSDCRHLFVYRQRGAKAPIAIPAQDSENGCPYCHITYLSTELGIERASNEVLREQLAAAHREGWEQAKREAEELVRDEYGGSWNTLYSAIAAMKYGGKTND